MNRILAIVAAFLIVAAPLAASADRDDHHPAHQSWHSGSQWNNGHHAGWSKNTRNPHNANYAFTHPGDRDDWAKHKHHQKTRHGCVDPDRDRDCDHRR